MCILVASEMIPGVCLKQHPLHAAWEFEIGCEGFGLRPTPEENGSVLAALADHTVEKLAKAADQLLRSS